MNTYAASNRKTILARWPFLQLTASAAACSASSRRAWSFVQSRMNVRMFTINLPGTMALAAAIAIAGSGAAWQAARAQSVPTINARVVATNIPGASAIAQVGTFIPGDPTQFGQCKLPHPIPTLFPTFIQPGAVLDPNRIQIGRAHV